MNQGKLTFKGGVHIPEHKELTEHMPIEMAKNPKFVYIPLHQHIGAPCDAVVSVGDKVKIAYLINNPEKLFTATFKKAFISFIIALISFIVAHYIK